ncbi:hypothetical protein B0H10DRAFT_2042230, partial [Mycena sp. CBHHK59/15]
IFKFYSISDNRCLYQICTIPWLQAHTHQKKFRAPHNLLYGGQGSPVFRLFYSI